MKNCTAFPLVALYFLKTALLSVNQNWEMFSCILLIGKQLNVFLHNIYCSLTWCIRVKCFSFTSCNSDAIFCSIINKDITTWAKANKLWQFNISLLSWGFLLTQAFLNYYTCTWTKKQSYFLQSYIVLIYCRKIHRLWIFTAGSTKHFPKSLTIQTNPPCIENWFDNVVHHCQ